MYLKAHFLLQFTPFSVTHFSPSHMIECKENPEDLNMSDLAATNCGCGEDRGGCGCNNGCGCDNGCNGGCNNGCGNNWGLSCGNNSCCNILWIIILLCLCGNNGWGCNNGCGNGDSCWIILVLLLLCGNNGCGCGC